jgi:hypothetical protein
MSEAIRPNRWKAIASFSNMTSSDTFSVGLLGWNPASISASLHLGQYTPNHFFSRMPVSLAKRRLPGGWPLLTWATRRISLRMCSRTNDSIDGGFGGAIPRPTPPLLVMAADAAIHGTGRHSVLERILAAPAPPAIHTIFSDTCVDGRLCGHDEKEGELQELQPKNLAPIPPHFPAPASSAAVFSARYFSSQWMS